MTEENMFSRDNVILGDLGYNLTVFKEKIQEGAHDEGRRIIKDIIYLYDQLGDKGKLKLLPFDQYAMMRVLIDTIAEVSVESEAVV